MAQNLQKLKNELLTDGIRFLNILDAQNDKARLSSFFVHLAQSTCFFMKKAAIIDILRFSKYAATALKIPTSYLKKGL